MVDTVRTLAALQLLLADNVAGDISAQDVRDFLVSTYPVVVRKAADESVTSSNVLQDDDELTFDIGADEIWVVNYWLLPTSTSATPDFKPSVSVPAGASAKFFVLGPIEGATGAESTIKSQTFAPGTGLAVGVPDTTFADRPTFAGASIANGANAGSVTLQWAQATSNGTATTLAAGSYLIAYRANS